MNKRITISTLDAMKASGDKFVMITAYDATFARLASEAGAEIVVITHEVSQRKVIAALDSITALSEVSGLAAHLGCL